jgi:hypothetical protein
MIMDKQLLDALNNVTNSLEALASVLNNKNEAKSDVGSAMKNSNIGNQVRNIEKVLNDVKKDTTEILSKQREILAIQKTNNQSTGIGGFDFSNKEDIKKGASTIVLLAGSILAIGTAFKIVGDVDFASVMALSLSLPLIAHSMAEMAKIKEFDMKNMFRISSSLFILSGALVLSSHLLSKVDTISAPQFLTMIGISSAFGIMALGLSDLMNKKIKFVNLLKVPALMIVLSGAISVSSQLLSTIKPLSVPQALTAIAIGGVFALLSYSLKNITKNVNNISPDELLTLPAIMVGLSTAIAMSSGILAQTQPINSLSQFISIIGIAAAFVPLAYAAKPLSKAVEGLNWKNVGMIPALMVAMSGAVTGSSLILQFTQEIAASKLLNIVLQAATLSAASIALYPAVKLFGNEKVIKSLAISVIALPLLATSIMTSSHLLALGNYDVYPSLEWSAGVGLSLVTFGSGALILGGIIAATGGMGALAVLAGLAGVVAISGTISASSLILGKGDYSNAPPVSWAFSTSILLTTFGGAALSLGAIIVGTAGLGWLGLQAGNRAVLSIAETMASASHILKKGKYTDTIRPDWAKSVSMAIGAFAPVYAILMADNMIKMLTFGLGGGVSVEDFTNAIKIISTGILESSYIFAAGSNKWGKAPTKEWAEGVGTAIGAFAPVFKILYEKDIVSAIFGSSVSAEDMKKTITTIAGGIIEAAKAFSGTDVDWSNSDKSAPTKKWSEGVAESIGAFARIYELGKGVFDVDADEIGEFNAIIAGTGSTYNESSNSIIDTMIRMNRKLLTEKFIQGNPSTNLVQVLSDYVKFIGEINESDTSIKNIASNNNIISKSLESSATGAVKFANAVGMLATNIAKLDVSKLNAFKEFTGITVELANVNQSQFTSVMDSFNKRTEVMAQAFETSTFKNFVDNVGNFTASLVPSKNKNNQERSLDDVYNVLGELRVLFVQMVQYSKTFADYANEQRLNDTTPINKRKQNS